MSTARSADDFLVTGTLENENTLMTDYWLEFVAAHDGRAIRPPNSFAIEEIQARLQIFVQKINGLIENQAEMRRTLDTVFPEIQSPISKETAVEGTAPPG